MNDKRLFTDLFTTQFIETDLQLNQLFKSIQNSQNWNIMCSHVIINGKLQNFIYVRGG